MYSVCSLMSQLVQTPGLSSASESLLGKNRRLDQNVCARARARARACADACSFADREQLICHSSFVFYLAF